MESYEALRIALALFLPIAVRLLALRDAARTEPDAACVALSARQLQLLRACGRTTLSATPSNKEVLLALAALAGHLRNNGPPGWILLGRARLAACGRVRAPRRPARRHPRRRA